jgi:TPR repeat protein
MLNETQTTTLTTHLPQSEAELVGQMARLVRAAGDQPAGAAAWPAFEQYWDKTMRRYLEAGLNRFLPQVQYLTNSLALYERGLALIAPNAVLQDFDEAAQCFSKAAEQGHPGAELNLGYLYEHGRGVRVDLAEAMRWYRKAAEQKQPHAPCRIADLYREGKGVEADLDEAAKWYRIEAEGKCSEAQFNLARICDSQNKLAEALKWYRRAAEAGNADARAHLGDVLSDGVFITPDYVEACQWLMLAAQEGDKVSEIRLRRVKAKLSAEQLAEVQKRVDRVQDGKEKKP